ncbi:MAG: metallophosphoesterase [Thermoguttaceae bacterium]|nr:metallophosphoesterase [Thermoguttaceae bacterium]MBQ3333970.1 metallophosphoesterase [Thermoguttaceae bacterium]MBQ6620736.1 metallophosphoesterase [Thermoguttaceae bacterium]
MTDQRHSRSIPALLILLAVFSFFTFVAAGTMTADDGAPALLDADDWTMIVIPDPQAYSRYTRNQGIFELMTGWIAEAKDPLRVGAVVCVGDLVESNGVLADGGKFGNQTCVQMWKSVSHAFEKLDGVYPYVLTLGNHDYGPEFMPDGNHYGIHSSITRETKFNDYFTPERNSAWEGSLVEMAPNAFGKKTLENAAYELTVPGGGKILVVALEFVPRDATLQWAKELFARPQYADTFGVIVTHSYMFPLSGGLGRIGKEGYPICDGDANSGQQIWEKLVKPSSNIRLVLCGHVSKADDFEGCCGCVADFNDAGKKVTQLVFDTQAMGGGWEGDGGDGWLQLLEFTPDMKKMRVRTFSPLFWISPTTRQHAWSHLDCCEFQTDLD